MLNIRYLLYSRPTLITLYIFQFKCLLNLISLNFHSVQNYGNGPFLEPRQFFLNERGSGGGGAERGVRVCYCTTHDFETAS